MLARSVTWALRSSTLPRPLGVSGPAPGLPTRQVIPHPELVDPVVSRELGVKGQTQNRGVANHYGMALDRGVNVQRLIGAFDDRRADEDSPEGLLEEVDVHIRLEAVGLSAIGVPAHRYRQDVEALLVGQPVEHAVRQQDKAGTSRQHRHPGFDLPQQRLLKTEFAQQLVHGPALASREDQTVEVIELVRTAQRYRVGAEPPQRQEVFPEGALQSEDTDLWCAHALGPPPGITNRARRAAPPGESPPSRVPSWLHPIPACPRGPCRSGRTMWWRRRWPWPS